MIAKAPHLDLIQSCRRHELPRYPTLIKRAMGPVGRGGGEQGPESSFEMALSNLAHAVVQDRAPQMMEFEVGFQLLEKSDDNTRAVGVFAFLVGEQIYLAPVFYLNGEIKGHELLYIKDSNTFVPMSENWVNYLINRKPLLLGNEVGRDLRSQGVMEPDLRRLSESPYKTASDNRPTRHQIKLAFAAASQLVENYKPVLAEFIKESRQAQHIIANVLAARPHLAQPLVQLYGAEAFRKAAECKVNADTGKTSCSTEASKAKAPKIHAIPPSTRERQLIKIGHLAVPRTQPYPVTVITYTGDPRDDLSDQERRQLLREGLLIKDAREKASQVYRNQKRHTLAGPAATGLYDILTRPGKMERALVIVGPLAGAGRRPAAVAIRLSDNVFAVRHPAKLLAEAKHEQDGKEALRRWVDGQSSVKDLSKDGFYIAIGRDGDATAPFSAGDKRFEDEGMGVYNVNWADGGCCCMNPNRDAPLPEWDELTKLRGESGSVRHDGDRARMIAVNSFEGGRPRLREGILYVPRSWKIIKIKDAFEGAKHDEGSTEIGGEPAPEYEAFIPGNHADFQMEILKQASFTVSRPKPGQYLMEGRLYNGKQALTHLVGAWDLREKDARQILKEAAYKPEKYIVKFAQPPQWWEQGFTMPQVDDRLDATGSDAYFNSGLPVTERNPQEIPFRTGPNEPRPQMTGPPEPFTGVGASIQQALASGQREVIDAGSLGSMLRTSRDDAAIDKYIPKLMGALDATGRLLFNFYWRRDRFEDRYGADNLPELEDSLKNTFDANGNLALFLKQRAHTGAALDIGDELQLAADD